MSFEVFGEQWNLKAAGFLPAQHVINFFSLIGFFRRTGFRSLRHRLLLNLTQANSLRPRVSGYVWIRNFFFPSTRIRRIRKDKVADWRKYPDTCGRGLNFTKKKLLNSLKTVTLRCFRKCNCEFCQYFQVGESDFWLASSITLAFNKHLMIGPKASSETLGQLVGAGGKSKRARKKVAWKKVKNARKSVRVESSSCCFPRELASFVCPRELGSFDPRHVPRSRPVGKRVWVGRYNKWFWSIGFLEFLMSKRSKRPRTNWTLNELSVQL